MGLQRSERGREHNATLTKFLACHGVTVALGKMGTRSYIKEVDFGMSQISQVSKQVLLCGLPDFPKIYVL